MNLSTSGRLFYTYVESESKPLTDPVILWLEGCDARVYCGHAHRHAQRPRDLCHCLSAHHAEPPARLLSPLSSS